MSRSHADFGDLSVETFKLSWPALILLAPADGLDAGAPGVDAAGSGFGGP